MIAALAASLLFMQPAAPVTAAPATAARPSRWPTCKGDFTIKDFRFRNGRQPKL